ncbi:uncharacterized protein LOC144118904 [Amblyomma americanum]
MHALCAQGLSFLALILLSGRLYEASKEIAFLRLVLAAWIPSEADLMLGGAADDHKSLVLDRSRQTLTNLKGDLEAFLLELTSARTTLALSVVFVIYMLSGWWMVFALKQAKDNVSVVHP